MPIIQPVIKGGGTTPSGTKQITTNGTHDVAGYANADVQVPTTAPERYLELGKDSNNYLIKAGKTLVNLNGITGISDYILMDAYHGSSVVSGYVDLSNIVTVEKEGLERCFKGCVNLTGVSLRDLTTVVIISR